MTGNVRETAELICSALRELSRHSQAKIGIWTYLLGAITSLEKNSATEVFNELHNLYHFTAQDDDVRR